MTFGETELYKLLQTFILLLAHNLKRSANLLQLKFLQYSESWVFSELLTFNKYQFTHTEVSLRYHNEVSLRLICITEMYNNWSAFISKTQLNILQVSFCLLFKCKSLTNNQCSLITYCHFAQPLINYWHHWITNDSYSHYFRMWPLPKWIDISRCCNKNMQVFYCWAGRGLLWVTKDLHMNLILMTALLNIQNTSSTSITILLFVLTTKSGWYRSFFWFSFTL